MISVLLFFRNSHLDKNRRLSAMFALATVSPPPPSARSEGHPNREGSSAPARSSSSMMAAEFSLEKQAISSSADQPSIALRLDSCPGFQQKINCGQITALRCQHQRRKTSCPECRQFAQPVCMSRIFRRFLILALDVKMQQRRLGRE